METNKKRLIRIVVGAALFAAAILLKVNDPILKLALFLAPFIVIGGDVILKAARNIARGQVFDENFLIDVYKRQGI